jgi:DNA-binding CsgD family transcriptional regulator
MGDVQPARRRRIIKRTIPSVTQWERNEGIISCFFLKELCHTILVVVSMAGGLFVPSPLRQPCSMLSNCMNSEALQLERERDPGGDGIVDVDARVRELLRSLVQRIAADSPSLPGSIQELILEAEVDGVRYLLIRQVCQTPGGQSVLSPREVEISRMVAKGYPNKVIAGVLDISPWTVCTHLRRVFAKLGVSTRAAMVARIIQEGVIGPSAPRESGTRSVQR